jgi:hypothetical protein
LKYYQPRQHSLTRQKLLSAPEVESVKKKGFADVVLLTLPVSFGLCGLICLSVQAAEKEPEAVAKTASAASSLQLGVISKDVFSADEKINTHFTPVPIPCRNKVRGLVLSGKAEMVKIRKDGSADVGGKTIKWHCKFLLSTGTVLITADKTPILVKAGKTVVFMDTGSTAVIYYGKNATRCANLNDRKQGSMKVMFGKHFLDLDPGREAILVKDAGKQEPIHSAVRDGIGWQDLQQVRVDGLVVFTCKVSGKDILKAWEVYRQLNESPISEDHALLAELLKTVAALDSMYDKHVGPYALTPYKYGVEGKPKDDKKT